jgi:hypothetical protein
LGVAYGASGVSRDIYNRFFAPLASNPADGIAQATVPLEVVITIHHFWWENMMRLVLLPLPNDMIACQTIDKWEMMISLQISPMSAEQASSCLTSCPHMGSIR